jgi:hypothetical protein
MRDASFAAEGRYSQWWDGIPVGVTFALAEAADLHSLANPTRRDASHLDVDVARAVPPGNVFG